MLRNFCSFLREWGGPILVGGLAAFVGVWFYTAAYSAPASFLDSLARWLKIFSAVLAASALIVSMVTLRDPLRGAWPFVRRWSAAVVLIVLILVPILFLALSAGGQASPSTTGSLRVSPLPPLT